MYTPPLYHWPPKSLWSQLPSNKRTWNTFSAYFHFPFCRSLCDFCGYETRLISKGSVSAFSRAAIAQLEGHAETDELINCHLKSVFFGGGTASLMPDELIAALLAVLKNGTQNFRAPEVTLECEPGTISRAKLRQARIHGINRVSVCAQSFDDVVLKAIGRKHTGQQSVHLLDDAVSAGIQNIHLDLMYGLPGQTQQDWERTLKTAASLSINHISTYKLYVFKHGFLNRQGHPRGMEESATQIAKARAMYASSQEILGGAGFEQYTLTEYARPGARSEYIRGCFDGGNILPIGPGAFGRCGNELWENLPYVQKYGLQFDSSSARAFKLSSVEAFKRDVILGLWLLREDLAQTAAKHFVTIRPELIELLDDLRRTGAINYADGTVSLAEHQRFGAGEVMRRLADLSAEQWAITESSCVESHNSDLENYVTGSHVKRLGTLLRMVRLDPRLFNALRTDPNETLQNLGYNVLETHVRALIDAIREEQNYNGDSDAVELRNIWFAIQQEHVYRQVS